MRMTNTIRDEIIKKSIDYIYGDLVKKTNESLEEDFKEIVEFFKSTNMYKRGVQVYKDYPEYIHGATYLSLELREVHYKNSTFFLDGYRDIPVSIVHEFCLNCKEFDINGLEKFAAPNGFGFIRFPSYGYLIDDITRDENGNYIVSPLNDDRIYFNRFFEKEDSGTKDKYMEIYNRMFNTFWKTVEVIYGTWKKLFDIVYSVNTTNQLFNILPNAGKFLNYTSKLDRKFEASINEELNNLLN